MIDACLTEVAISFGLAAHLTAQLLQVPEEIQKRFDSTMMALVDALPGIDIINVNQLLSELAQREDDVAGPGRRRAFHPSDSSVRVAS